MAPEEEIKSLQQENESLRDKLEMALEQLGEAVDLLQEIKTLAS